MHPPPYDTQRKAAMLCIITLFGRFTVNNIMYDPQWMAIPRDLDVVELWSGVEAIAQCALAHGLQAECHDQLKDPNNPIFNIANMVGFLAALKMVMWLRVGGLLAMGPDCSSFVFAPSSLAKRKRGSWTGDTNHQFVKDGNLMASMAAFFMCLAVARGVEAFIENPAGSMMFSFIRATLDLIPWATTSYMDRCAYLSADGHLTENYKKTYKFVATGPWIASASKRCSCTKDHMPLVDIGPFGQITGRRDDMKRSAAYPDKLGAALFAAWLNMSEDAAKNHVQVKVKQPSCPAVQPKPSTAMQVCKRQSNNQHKLNVHAANKCSTWLNEANAMDEMVVAKDDGFGHWPATTTAVASDQLDITNGFGAWPTAN